jgi:hypothetical protein
MNNKASNPKNILLISNKSESGGNLVSITTENLLKNATHYKIMKPLEITKINKTKKYILYQNNQNNQGKTNSKINKAKNKKKKSLYSINKYPDYLEKLINTYYDNDKCVSNYLSKAHHRMHILPPARRIIVIGDIHGDFDAAVKCLILAGCIAAIEPPMHKTVENMDAFFKLLIWTGGDTQVVQLGDQIDRVRPHQWDKNSISQTEAHEDEGTTLEIFFLFWHLNQLALPQAGAVHCIIGNHEIMNIEGDFSYVSSAEFYSFKNHLTQLYYPNSKYPYHSRTLKNTYKTRKSKGLPDGYRERLYAFSPTGLCSNFMAQNYYTLLQIGNWLFCHGSPTLSTFESYEIDLINTITSMYLLGLDSPQGSNNNRIEYHFDKIMNNDDSSREPTSLIWSRTFGHIQSTHSESELESMLDNILAAYNEKNNNTSSQNKATHIAIGHTPQIHNNKQIGINSICNQRVWRCDVGMSKAFTNTDININSSSLNNTKKRKIQVLEIIDNKPRILSGF